MAFWSRRRAFPALIVVTVIAIAAAWVWHSMTAPPASVALLLRQARRSLLEEDYQSARSFCQQILQQDADHAQALLLAGEAAMKDQQFDDALQYFRRIPPSDSEDSIAAQLAAAEVLRATGRIGEAESGYRELIRLRPAHAIAHERLAFILDLQGRRWESIPHLLEQLRQDQISFSCLIRLGTRDSAIPFPEELERIRKANHDPAAVKLADAVSLLAHQETKDAQPLLRDAIQLNPELIEAHARLGRLLADDDISRIPEWQSQLPEDAMQHPDVHVAIGLWCVHAGQTAAAVRSFQQAAVIDPNQRIAHYQLAQLLATADFSENPEFTGTAKWAAERARLLQKLAATMNRLSLDRSDISAMQSAADLLEQLGRYWEAYGWCGMVLVNDPRQSETRLRMQSLSRRLSPSVAMTDLPDSPVARLRLTDSPAPVWPSVVAGSYLQQPTAAGSQLQFSDQAEAAGLQFTYFHGREQVEPGTKMYEFAGGGVAVLDYDADGLPDVYLTQGCRWPPDTESTEHRDRLFRNLGNGRFEDVTDEARLGDGWFSQGVAVGDLNSDGWPDLYVANIGTNRLYCNNGDGTFRDVTDHAGLNGTQWTTSCLMADLDGDRLPDLYDVNYLKGEDLFERLCPIDGQLRACVPGEFSPEEDRIHISQQDGRFREVEGQQSDALKPASPGLGIIAADMDGSGRLSLFVANDVMANAFLVNETQAGSPLALREDALLAGLAFDRDGRAQACMGVATDDVDENGLLDIFVTNYYEESNSLYLQVAPGRFVESSRPAGLYEPSLKQLGFGTQFLDADLDGSLDLVVANGHLDDFSYMDIPHYMRPQFFRNKGDGQLREATGGGGYFERRVLGRSMAVLDWNADGLPDFITTHIGSPIALVTNQTTGQGHWLKLRLYGTASSRDAIGCKVTVQCGDRQWTRQLTAGSGYQASNERMLLFGLGTCSHIDRLKIQWPSGRRQTFEDIASDQQLALVEHADAPFSLPPNR